jgi:hydrogenase nickel incorporation protein HypA/HybF
MHEISTAESIVEIAEQQPRAQNARSIQLIKLRPGEFTTIVREALEFACEIAR